MAPQPVTADLASLYGRAVEQFGRRLEGVGDRWRDPTPDTEWDVRALVNHVVVEDLWAPSMLSGKTVAEVGDAFDGDQLGDDPLARWAEATPPAIEVINQEGALERTVHASFGDISGRDYVSQMLCDHLIHGWDLARATGGDERLDPELVDVVYDFIAPQADQWRGAGVFGPRVEVPADGDRQTQLLALTGRDPQGRS